MTKQVKLLIETVFDPFSSCCDYLDPEDEDHQELLKEDPTMEIWQGTDDQIARLTSGDYDGVRVTLTIDGEEIAVFDYGDYYHDKGDVRADGIKDIILALYPEAEVTEKHSIIGWYR